MTKGNLVLVLGSSPSVADAALWPRPDKCTIVAINNAWRVRPDWDCLVHAGDFPAHRHPPNIAPQQQVHSHQSYVPAQNRYGGFVYAGGTMAFTAGYWALDALKPRILAYFGCDMVYSGSKTHFYGNGEPDPLRDDLTLRSLEAKSARLMALAARQGCACVNLSHQQESRLIFPRASLDNLSRKIAVPQFDSNQVNRALIEEEKLGYMIEDGEYWHHMDQFDAEALARIDRLWSDASRLAESEAELV